MSSTTIDILSIVAAASADSSEPELSEVIEYISENPDYSEVFAAILEQTTAINDNLSLLISYAEQIFTIVVYVLVLLIIYGVGKLFMSLFT